MRDILNEPAFSGRLHNYIFMDISQQGQGNKCFFARVLYYMLLLSLFNILYHSRLGQNLFSEGKIWESLRRFTMKHLRDYGFKKPQIEKWVLD